MIIFDASTLILLGRTGLLETFLEATPEQIVAPKEVERECCEEKESFDALLIAEAIKNRRISVKPLRKRRVSRQLRRDFNLGSGEAGAVALAFSMKDSTVATDDRKAINACRILRIRYTTALDILVRMYEKGLLKREEALLKLELLKKCGRYKGEIVSASNQDWRCNHGQDDEYKDG
jgi:predicted nucleic acid-binding protein